MNPREPTPAELSKRVAEALKRSEPLVREALRIGRSLVGAAADDRIRLR